MKTSIALHPHPPVIRRSLSQPEEIDLILMTLAARDRAAHRPAESGKYACLSGFTYGVAQKRATQRVPDHYMFFSSRNVPVRQGHGALPA